MELNGTRITPGERHGARIPTHPHPTSLACQAARPLTDRRRTRPAPRNRQIGVYVSSIDPRDPRNPRPVGTTICGQSLRHREAESVCGFAGAFFTYLSSQFSVSATV